MKHHLHPHPSSRYDRIEGDELVAPSSRRRRGRGGPGMRRPRGPGGPPGFHRSHPGHGRPDAATRRARLESYQRDLEQELADVAERIRRLDEAS